MKTTLKPLYKSKAVMLDPTEVNAENWANEFMKRAIQECYDFLPDDWYISYVSQDQQTIIVNREKYEGDGNFQPNWIFKITGEPIDEDNTQWVVFDVMLDESPKLYAYEF